MSKAAGEYSLREAGRDDCAALALIGAATFLDSFAGVLASESIVVHCARAHSAQAYERHLAGGARAWLAEASIGRAPIGFALAGVPDLDAAREGDVELKRIYALSRYHGRGIGYALMEQVVLAYPKAARLILGVYARNTRALAFYERQGFEMVGTRQFNVGGTLYDDKVLARPLRAVTHADEAATR